LCPRPVGSSSEWTVILEVLYLAADCSDPLRATGVSSSSSVKLKCPTPAVPTHHRAFLTERPSCLLARAKCVGFVSVDPAESSSADIVRFCMFFMPMCTCVNCSTWLFIFSLALTATGLSCGILVLNRLAAYQACALLSNVDQRDTTIASGGLTVCKHSHNSQYHETGGQRHESRMCSRGRHECGCFCCT
jgi:hypothetical protein